MERNTDMELVMAWVVKHISDYIESNFDDDWCMDVEFDEYSFNHDLKEFVKRNDSIGDFDIDKFSGYINDNYSMFSNACYVTYDAVEIEIYYDDLERIINEY